MSVFSDNAKSYYEDHNVQGKILLFDYNAPDKDVTELKFSDGFDLTNFVPHGISLYQSPKSGMCFCTYTTFQGGALYNNMSSEEPDIKIIGV